MQCYYCPEFRAALKSIKILVHKLCNIVVYLHRKSIAKRLTTAHFAKKNYSLVLKM